MVSAIDAPSPRPYHLLMHRILLLTILLLPILPATVQGGEDLLVDDDSVALPPLGGLVDEVLDPTTPPARWAIGIVLLAAILWVGLHQSAKKIAESLGYHMPAWLHRVTAAAGSVALTAAGLHAAGYDLLDPHVWITVVVVPLAWGGHKALPSAVRG